MSMTSINAIEGRTQDRIRALWGSEGAIAKNALDANTDCQSLLDALKEIGQRRCSYYRSSEIMQYEAECMEDDNCIHEEDMEGAFCQFCGGKIQIHEFTIPPWGEG